jgi:hypothetical protein
VQEGLKLCNRDSGSLLTGRQLGTALHQEEYHQSQAADRQLARSDCLLTIRPGYRPPSTHLLAFCAYDEHSLAEETGAEIGQNGFGA